MKKKIEENINDEKKVDNNIEIFKNNYLQKKTKLMDSIEDFFKQEDKKKDKEKTDVINEDINKENKPENDNEKQNEPL